MAQHVTRGFVAVRFVVVLVLTLVSIVLLVIFTRLRLKLSIPEQYHVRLTDGHFFKMPVFRHMRRYIYIVLSGSVVLLAIAILMLADVINPSGTAFATISNLLLAVLGFHVAFTVAYEATDAGNPYYGIKDRDIVAKIDSFRRQLWSNGMILFGMAIAVSLLSLLRN